jgi:hypothetical protein
VQVLDHEHQRPVGRQSLDHPEDQLEQPRAPGLARRGRRAGRLGVELGEQASQVRARRSQEPLELIRVHHPGQRPECVDHRAEWQTLATELDAATGKNPGAACPGPLGRLLDEPRLAHASLAADQHDGGLPLHG